MNSFKSFLLYSLMVVIGLLQYSCTVSGKIKFRVPGGDVKIESKHKKDHHKEKEDDDKHKKKKKHDKKEHKDDD